MEKILGMPDVKNLTGHRSHVSVYELVRSGLFTKPIHIGRRSVGWPESEIEAVNAARIAGRSDDFIRGLVGQLHTKRQESAPEIEGAGIC